MRTLFILSAPRSGSTLLATMLGAHSHIVTLLESRWFAVIALRARHLRRTMTRARRSQALYGLLQQSAFLEQLATPPERLRDIVEEFTEAPEEILGALMAEFAARTKPAADLWGEKSCPHVFYVSQIERAFPNTRYIQLLRDPRATVNSLVKPSVIESSDDWCVATHVYLRHNQAIERGLARIAPDRRLTIHYEDLVARPREELQRCCEFLGVRFDDAMLSRERFRQNLAALGGLASPKAADRVTTAYVDEWRKALGPTKVRCIDRAVRGLASATRYRDARARTAPPSYAPTLALLAAKHACLRAVETAVEMIRGRPFVWSRLGAMLGRAVPLPQRLSRRPQRT